MVPFWVGCAFIRLPLQSRACLWDLLQHFLFFSYCAAPNLFFQSTKTFQSGSEQLMTTFPFRSELLFTGEWFFFFSYKKLHIIRGWIVGWEKSNRFYLRGGFLANNELKGWIPLSSPGAISVFAFNFLPTILFLANEKEKPSSNCTKYIKLSCSS